MGISVKVAHNLQILGLPPDATSSEIRAAFRRLARTCHPDVVGKQGARKFEQITGAYTFLKNLSQDELNEEVRSEVPSAPKVSGWKWKGSWRRKRQVQEHLEEDRRKETEREAEEQVHRSREASVEAILSSAEQALEDLLVRVEQETRSCSTQDLTLRLSSGIPQVRHLALSRLGTLVNRRELLDAVLSLLQNWEIDEKTARLVSLLPLNLENHRTLAKHLVNKASEMPELLLVYLLRLSGSREADQDLLERYIQKAAPKGVALILRQWPQESFVSPSTLRFLLVREEPVILVSLLNLMKQRSIPCPEWARERLKTHLAHPNAAVRVWAKALLSDDLQ
ncbi:MAG: DnaJ domain-containing protein [Synergistaceae bacterium]|jgi:curved DNA-binding protein CbpA|nr:DnaJ domain-containing protein [Synergistaceae bacterium]